MQNFGILQIFEILIIVYSSFLREHIYNKYGILDWIVYLKDPKICILVLWFLKVWIDLIFRVCRPAKSFDFERSTDQYDPLICTLVLWLWNVRIAWSIVSADSQIGEGQIVVSRLTKILGSNNISYKYGFCSNCYT